MPDNQKMKKIRKSMGMFLILLGMASIIGVFFAYRNTQSFIDSAIKTNGTVTDIRKEKQHSSSSTGMNSRKKSRKSYSKVKYSYYPTFTFTDSAGNEHTIRSNTGSSPSNYAIGDVVEVLYSDKQPEEAKINSFLTLWGLLIVMVIMSGMFLAFGLIMFFASGAANQEEGDQTNTLNHESRFDE